MTRIGITSDLHGHLPEVPACDVLIIGGDVCPVDNHEHHYQRDFLRGPFLKWLLELRDRDIEVVGVAGNHDFVLQAQPGLGAGLPWTYLENSAALLWAGDLTVWGSPYSNRFGGWAFMEDDYILGGFWGEIPEGLDILITHGPPYGYGDRVNNDWNPDDHHVGSKSLAQRVKMVRPRLHVFGHIHEAAAMGSRGGDIWINASHVNELYEPVNPVHIVELTPRGLDGDQGSGA